MYVNMRIHTHTRKNKEGLSIFLTYFFGNEQLQNGKNRACFRFKNAQMYGSIHPT